jgi:outer membrane protein assembly factor BamA
VNEKVEGNYVTGLPLFNYDPNTGFGFGVGGFYTMNGPRTSPLFAYTPYRQRVFVQAFATTGGYQQHLVSFDGVYIGNTPYRLRAQLAFERNINANYFGVGESTLGPLSFQGVPHATYSDQVQASSALQPGGIATPDYNRYWYDLSSGTVALERSFLGGRVRVQYGFVAQYERVTLYDGQQTVGVTPSGQTTGATEGPTKLGIDCASHAVLGCDGGWDDFLRAGVVWDTRDFEPDPRSGLFVETTGEWSAKAFGSRFNYLRLTVSARAFQRLFLRDLVLAGRVLYSLQTAPMPFYSMNTLALTEGDQRGLGGEVTIRGYRQDRFVGPMAAVANVELRWTFVHFTLLKQKFSLQAAPLYDVGRVFDRVGLSASNWKSSAGGGLRVGWNQSTIIMFDAGFSSEDTGFFIDFGMPF